MMSEISSLFQRAWENIWKNRVLWLFSSLVLIDPLLRLVIPIQKSNDLTSSLLKLVIGFASIYFMFMSYAGVSFVAYCIAIGKPIDFQTAFQSAGTLFWRIIGLTFLLFVFVAPFLCSVFVLTFKQPPQITDFAHNFFFAAIPLSIFAAMWYFPITEMIVNGSKIGNSLKTAWTVFTHNFVKLAIIGLLTGGVFYVINLFVSMATVLVQNSFDFSALKALDFISPHLSFTGNNYYSLITTMAQTAWHTYSTSIFTLAYLKYSGVKMNKPMRS
jgi:hypothetical protein